VNTIDVPSVDDYTSKVESKGGTVVVPKMAVPGIGYMAYCTDPEGNMFGIMQSDPGAA
jgi:predicted enzyme related to lactoylglutathione lyase